MQTNYLAIPPPRKNIDKMGWKKSPITNTPRSSIIRLDEMEYGTVYTGRWIGYNFEWCKHDTDTVFIEYMGHPWIRNLLRWLKRCRQALGRELDAG